MTTNKEEIYSLLLEASKKNIISSKPNIVTHFATLEDLCSYDKIIEITKGDKKYRVTFNDDLPLQVSTVKIERVNRGCDLVRDLLNEIFNNYNVLVVPNAILSSNVEDLIQDYMPIVDDSCTITADADDAKDTINDYKILLGLQVELKDSFEGTTTNKRFLLNSYVTFENEKPKFNYGVEFTSTSEKSVENLEEIKDIDKERYNKLINGKILKMFSTDEDKERLFDGIVKGNKEISDYIEERDILADKNDVENRTMQFNITPVSVSLNKLQKKRITFTVASKSNPSWSASFVCDNFDPLAPENAVYKCQCCGSVAGTADNPLMVLKAEHNKPVVGCKKCMREATSNLYYGQLFTEDALALDKIDKLTYYKDDCHVCDVTGDYYYGDHVVEYKILCTPNKQRKSGFALKEKTCQCPNCRTTFAGEKKDLGNKLYCGFKSPDFVCCDECVNTENYFADKNYILSELSKKAFIRDPKHPEYAICNDNGKIAHISELSRCPKCGNLYDRSSVHNICGHCKAASNADIASRRIPLSKCPDFIAKFVDEFYGKGVFVEAVRDENSLNLAEFRCFDKNNKRMLYIAADVDKEEILDSKLN